MRLIDYSDPIEVERRAKEIFSNDVILAKSNRKDKKYKIYLNGKWINFGQMGYEDYTRHQDEKRRANFRNRNKRWSKMNYDTPGFLSYYLLW